MACRAAHAKRTGAGEIADCSARLAQGKSNGGLLMGVEANQVRRARASPLRIAQQLLCCASYLPTHSAMQRRRPVAAVAGCPDAGPVPDPRIP